MTARTRPPKTGRCPECRGPMAGKASQADYCSVQCRRTAWQRARVVVRANLSPAEREVVGVLATRAGLSLTEYVTGLLRAAVQEETGWEAER